VPRFDCNTPHSGHRRKRRRKSAHKGMGGDRKLKALKVRIAAESPRRAKSSKKKKKEPA